MSKQDLAPPSDHFTYREGRLHCENVPFEEIASHHATPAYVYSGSAIDQAYDVIDDALSFTPHLLAYAIKANANLAILKRLAQRGCAADIVSKGELARALHAGFTGERIVFSGVGKQRDEIEAALDAGVRALHVENIQELDLIEAIAEAKGRPAPIALRVNPDVDPQTHPYIATGLKESKFGLDFATARSQFGRIVQSPWLSFEAIATHIGSQLSSPQPLQEAITLVGRLAVEAIEAGADLKAIDVGGGWPMAYGNETTSYPSAAAFGEAIKIGLQASRVSEHGLMLLSEPGRAIVGDAGVLLTRVLYTKRQGDKHFVIVDAAMTELIRPALYGAHHALMLCEQKPDPQPLRDTDVVGPVCESGDFLAKNRSLPALDPGDLIAIRGAGAYAREMASTYNGRLPAIEIMVESTRHRVVRKRPPIESLWADETP